MKPASSTGPRMNEEITAPQVRLIDEQGEMVGVVSIREALRQATEAGLDLIEITANSEPPVCKILDSGKHKYELQKRKAAAKKKQKVIQVKEIKIRPTIDENDYQVKLRHMKEFIAEENKVKVTLKFRGREIAHADIGMAVLERIVRDMEEIARPESMPKMEGKQAHMILVPKKV